MKKMSVFRAVFALVSCATALSMLSPVWAQPITDKPVAESPTQTPLDIDPQAKKAFEELLARYKKLRSYSDTTTLKMNGDAPSVAQIIWERPNKAAIVIKRGDKEMRGVSDGTTLWAVNPDNPGYYIERPAEKERFFSAFNETGSSSPGLGFIIGDMTMEELTKEGLRVLRFQGEEKVGDVQTRIITAKLDFDDGGTGVISCYVGVEDGLLHQVSGEYGGMGRGMKVVETHSDIRLDPQLTADTWKFTPPAGLKPIDFYSKVQPDRFAINYKVGQVLPDFEAPGLDGKKIDLATYGDQNKVVILHFFTARNAEYEVEGIKSLLEKYKAQGLAVIGVSLDARRPIVEAFVQEKKIDWAIVFDEKGWNNVVSTKYGVRVNPTSLLIGRDGRLISIERRPFGDPDFETRLAAALKTP